MADTDEEQQQTGQTITPPQERLVDLLGQMREARRAYDASEIGVSEFYTRAVDIDRRLTLRLADNFNLSSGLLTSLPESQLSEEFRSNLTQRLSRRMPAEDIEQAFMDRIRSGSGAPPDYFRDENAEANARLLIQNFMQNHAQLSALTYEDAVAIAQGTMDDGQFVQKYGAADQTVLSAAVMLTLEVNKDRVRAEHPELQTRIEEAGLFGIGRQMMIGVPEDEEFKAWETQKRQQIVEAITSDRGLMRDIAALKPLLDCTDERDFQRQHRLRVGITEDLTNIYRRVYDVPGLNNRNVLTVYAPLEKTADDRLLGHAGGIPGVSGDDFAIIRNSLYRELLLVDPVSTDQGVTADYLQNVMEELRHSVDLHNADRLINREMSADDISYRHTSLIFLNRFFTSDDPPAYSEQYMERTAKESAADISEQVMVDLPEQPGSSGASPSGVRPASSGTKL